MQILLRLLVNCARRNDSIMVLISSIKEFLLGLSLATLMGIIFSNLMLFHYIADTIMELFHVEHGL